jgi:predicted ribonuclease YlaK
LEVILNDVSSLSTDEADEQKQSVSMSIPVQVNSAACVFTVHNFNDDRIVDIASFSSVENIVSTSSSSLSAAAHASAVFNSQSSMSGHIIRPHGYLLSAYMAECQCLIDVAIMQRCPLQWPME